MKPPSRRQSNLQSFLAPVDGEVGKEVVPPRFGPQPDVPVVGPAPARVSRTCRHLHSREVLRGKEFSMSLLSVGPHQCI